MYTARCIFFQGLTFYGDFFAFDVFFTSCVGDDVCIPYTDQSRILWKESRRHAPLLRGNQACLMEKRCRTLQGVQLCPRGPASIQCCLTVPAHQAPEALNLSCTHESAGEKMPSSLASPWDKTRPLPLPLSTIDPELLYVSVTSKNTTFKLVHFGKSS